MPARRGFACISPERRREIASKGGKKAHARGTAHRWTPEEARAAGKKGGALISQDTARMAELGRKGGKAKRKPRTVGGHDVGIDREVAAARRECEAVTQRAIQAEADLATSRAALEDVLWQEAHPNVEVVSRRRAEDDEKLWVAYDRSGNVNDTEWFAIAEGDTWKEALRNARRALAQEAGDATR